MSLVTGIFDGNGIFDGSLGGLIFDDGGLQGKKRTALVEGLREIIPQTEQIHGTQSQTEGLREIDAVQVSITNGD